MDFDRRTTFLTGGTGFIGQYVLRGLLQSGARVVVLLRRPQAHSWMRLAGLMRLLDVDIEHPRRAGTLRVLEGALPHDLPRMDAGEVDQIVHAAACLQMGSAEPGEPFATNVEGVKALGAWADTCGAGDFHFVSTAYTCGRDADVVQETLHHPQPRFGTDYELSKWQAEAYLSHWADRSGRRLTILRPALVVGDSVTGYTTQYGGFYQLARVIELLQQFFDDQRAGPGAPGLPIRIPADPLGRQNLVPVDYVADAIVEITRRQELHGAIYHLTDPNPPTNEQVKTWLEHYYRIQGGVFVDRIEELAGESLPQRMFLQMNELILRQFSFVPEFDCSNTTAALAESRISVPRLDEQMVSRLLDFARAHAWGRCATAAAS